MITPQMVVIVSLLSAVLSAEKVDIDALQNQCGNALRPELRVREVVESGNRRLALLTTITVNQGRFEFFNPFGDEATGRCYRVAVVDAEGLVVRDLIPTTALNLQSTNSDSWLHVFRNGLIGRCHVLPPDIGKGIVPGRYSLVLIVNRRMVHASPRSFNASNNSLSWDASWRTQSQDTPLCGSSPVTIDIDKSGNLCFPGILRFDAVDVDTTVSEKRELSLTVKIVNPEDSWLLIPGMNLYSLMDRPLSETVDKEDGTPTQRHFRPLGGWSGPGFISESDAAFVPKNGIVGGVLLHAGMLEPGKYRVAVQVNESIYRDKLFVNGKKVDRSRTEWPIIFQSKPRDFVVGE